MHRDLDTSNNEMLCSTIELASDDVINNFTHRMLTHRNWFLTLESVCMRLKCGVWTHWHHNFQAVWLRAALPNKPLHITVSQVSASQYSLVFSTVQDKQLICRWVRRFLKHSASWWHRQFSSTRIITINPFQMKKKKGLCLIIGSNEVHQCRWRLFTRPRSFQQRPFFLRTDVFRGSDEIVSWPVYGVAPAPCPRHGAACASVERSGRPFDAARQENRLKGKTYQSWPKSFEHHSWLAIGRGSIYDGVAKCFPG